LGEGIRLEISTRACGATLRLGDSLAVNGCCLTIVATREHEGGWVVSADLLQETWRRTNLHACRPGVAVNLERPLRADGRLDGHFVTGHVDCAGRIERWEPSGADWYLRVAAPPELLRYVVFKGSIALDGISLTIAEVFPEGFAVWIIPRTYEATALAERLPGDWVNLEGDILGKYAEKFLSARVGERPTPP
jgi:riboflavin synthase